MYIARKSNHINEDIIRNWSSWNFGEGGVFGTFEEIEDAKKEAIENDECFEISGFELYGSDIKKSVIKELYDNYWVLVDTTNGQGSGIFGIELDSDDNDTAIQEALSREDYFGEGIRFDANDAILIHSYNDIHIFKCCF